MEQPTVNAWSVMSEPGKSLGQRNGKMARVDSGIGNIEELAMERLSGSNPAA